MPMPWLEILGYAASAITAVSLMMASHVRLRILNLIGSTVFAVYGFLIQAYPVAALNAFIACVNIFFLYRVAVSKTLFTLLPMTSHDVYFEQFIRFYQKEIERLFPDFSHESCLMTDVPADRRICLYILRNMVTAGVLVARRDVSDASVLHVELDYAVPAFRDYRTGDFLFRVNAGYFKDHGVRQILAATAGKSHARYLERVGFKRLPDQGKTGLGASCALYQLDLM